jgi:membrane-bound lytic murein transglycosylase A
MRLLPLAAALAVALLLGGCIPPGEGFDRAGEHLAHVAPVRPVPPAPVTARQAGVAAGPSISQLPIDPVRARDALNAFRTSCPSLVRRPDVSGLTQPVDWQPACAAAASWPDADAIGFFRRYFETARVGQGALFATGYYEPEIAGSRTPMPGYAVPIYGVPDDLAQQVDPASGRTLRGRLQDGQLVAYADRGQIEDQGLAGHAPIIGYAADPIDLFFLQIQGSGRIRLPDGTVMRIGYAGDNGLPYTGIGKAMVAQGLITVDQGSMQGIVGWLRAHPDQADAVMRQNKAYVFFKERTGAGPLGSLGVPVTGHVTVAADPAFTPLGAPVWLSADRVEAGGLWVAQDTGGAIKGPNRFDTFWGAGADAERIAGGMSARGSSYLLLPVGTLARLGDGGQAARS